MSKTLTGALSKRPRISIPAQQYDGLSILADGALAKSPLVAEFLSEELGRAHLIRPGRPSIHVVQIGSIVEFREGPDGKTCRVTLVYPAHADIENSRISILTPVGAALLGMMSGQTIAFPAPDGRTRELTVMSVVNII